MRGNVAVLAWAEESSARTVAATVMPGPDPVGLGALSKRETMIALLVSAGLSNKEIGQRLEISHWTVSTHLKRIFTKLGISKRIEVCILVAASKSSPVDGAPGTKGVRYRVHERR